MDFSNFCFLYSSCGRSCLPRDPLSELPHGDSGSVPSRAALVFLHVIVQNVGLAIARMLDIAPSQITLHHVPLAIREHWLAACSLSLCGFSRRTFLMTYLRPMMDMPKHRWNVDT